MADTKTAPLTNTPQETPAIAPPQDGEEIEPGYYYRRPRANASINILNLTSRLSAIGALNSTEQVVEAITLAREMAANLLQVDDGDSGKRRYATPEEVGELWEFTDLLAFLNRTGFMDLSIPVPDMSAQTALPSAEETAQESV